MTCFLSVSIFNEYSKKKLYIQSYPYSVKYYNFKTNDKK